MNTFTKQFTRQAFWARQASFAQLDRISDLQLDVQITMNWLSNHKGPENIITLFWSTKKMLFARKI